MKVLARPAGPASACARSAKLAIRLSARHVRSRGLNYRTLLLVGINPRSEEVARIIEEHPHWGLKLVGFVAPNGEHGEEVAGAPVLGSANDLPRILQDEVVDARRAREGQGLLWPVDETALDAQLAG